MVGIDHYLSLQYFTFNSTVAHGDALIDAIIEFLSLKYGVRRA